MPESPAWLNLNVSFRREKNAKPNQRLLVLRIFVIEDPAPADHARHISNDDYRGAPATFARGEARGEAHPTPDAREELQPTFRLTVRLLD